MGPMRVQGFQVERKDSGGIEVIGWSQPSLKEVGAVPGLRTRVQPWQFGEEGGYSDPSCHSPSCFPAVRARACPGLHRFTSGCPGLLVATSGLTPTTGVTRGGWGQAGVQPRCSQVAQSVCRFPELPSLGRALQARTTSWFPKEVCGFSSFFLSFFPIGTKKN